VSGTCTTVDLLRHGEPKGGRRFRGQLDDPLSELGWRQMWAALPDIVPWQQIVSSPLQRCSAFAQSLAQQHSLPCSLEPRFKEIRFGEWEGLTPEEIQQRDGERYRRYRADPSAFMPPGSEPMSRFVARVADGWENLLSEQQGRHVLVICHAGVIRAVLCHVLGAPPERLFRIQIDYAAVTRFLAVADQPPNLVFHGSKLP
jgi:alpha-ribazole phosphatase